MLRDMVVLSVPLIGMAAKQLNPIQTSEVLIGGEM